MILNCSNAAFFDVPDMIPDEVVVIDMSHSALKKLNNDSFSNCGNVLKLDVSHTDISVFRNVMLRSMPNVETIVLDEAYISYRESNFPDDTFAGLLHLKSIRIWCNVLKYPRSLDEYAFILRKLPHTLEELSISIPGDENISQPLSKFTKLRKLGIHSFSGEFNTITNTTFKLLENIKIEELTIVASDLLIIEPLAFYHFLELKSLNMKCILCLSVGDFFSALIGLQHTKLEKLHLYSISMPPQHAIPELVILNGSFCENLNFPHLTDLHVDHSRLVGVRHRGGCFSQLSQMKVLNLQFNCFSLLEINGLNLGMMTNLIEINLSHQYNPLIERSDITFFSPMNLANLDMSYILQPSENIRNLTFMFLPPAKYLNFQGNSVTVLEDFVVLRDNLDTPMEVDFSRNNMISFAGSFDNALSIHNLTVASLILSENQLGEQLGERGDQIFKYFRDLTKLDLTLNGIKQLPYSTFGNLRKLEYLNLSKNALVLISFQISHMKSLKLLDMSENLVSQFNVKLQNDFVEVKSYSPNFKINMLGNPLQCSCETRSFLWWMYHRQSMFERFEKNTCTYNGNLTRFFNMEQLLKTIDYDCSSKLILKVTTSLFVSIVIVVALSIFVYRHKWSVLKFFLLEYITNRKLYQEFEESEEEYEYDAFISFHSDDHDWVLNELYELLDITYENADTDDDQRRFKLCIHERDFVPGELIEENILRSIESSRKTIVVLSRNFLQSVWCEFELQIARKECIERGRDLIIAVMLEPLPADTKLSRSVERLIRKNTYIEWPTNPLERMHFWNRIRSALAN